MSSKPESSCQTLQVFYRNLQEVYSIEAIYERVPDSQPDEQQVLVKSGIIFIVTSLDAFLKQLVTDAFDVKYRSINFLVQQTYLLESKSSDLGT